MKAMWTLAIKDLRILFRDRSGFFFTFFYPVIIAVFMGVIFSGNIGGSGPVKSVLSVYIIDQDSTEISQSFVNKLSQSEDMQLTPINLEQAQEDVRLGKKAAYILINKGFGNTRENMFTREAPVVEIGIDPSRHAEASLLTGLLMQYGAQDMQKIFTNPNLMRKQVQTSLGSTSENSMTKKNMLSSLDNFLVNLDSFNTSTSDNGDSDGEWNGLEPLKIEEKEIIRKRIGGPPSSFAITFPQGIIWGLMACISTFVLSLVTERNKGTLTRLRMAPLKSYHILGSKALACFMTTIIVSTILMLIGIFIFGIRVASYTKLALGLVIIAGAFVGFMMLLSVLSKTERSASGVSWAALIILAMVGGGMFPLFFMPDWLQSFSSISPMKWSILAIEGAIWRDLSFQELLKPYLVLAGFGLVSFITGVSLFRWSEKA